MTKENEFYGYCNGSKYKNECAEFPRRKYQKIKIPITQNGAILTGKFVEWKETITDKHGNKIKKKHKEKLYEHSLLILDFDAKGNKLDIKDFDNNTFTVETMSGGLHQYFWLVDGTESISQSINVRDNRLKGLDVRCDQGIIFAPGSHLIDKKHKTEGDYKVVQDIPIRKIPYKTYLTLLYKYTYPKVKKYYKVDGINLQEFIAGNIDIHKSDVKPDKEFIVWQQALFCLRDENTYLKKKSAEVAKRHILEIFSHIPGFERDTCEQQINIYWDTVDEWEYRKRKKITKNIAPSKKINAIEEFVDDLIEENCNIYYIKELDTYKKWNGKFYDEMSNHDFKVIVKHFCVSNNIEASPHKMRRIRESFNLEQGLSIKDFRISNELINVNNGVYNLKTHELLPHDPNNLFINMYNANIVDGPLDTPCVDIIRDKIGQREMDKLESFLLSKIHKDMSSEVGLWEYGETRSGKGTFNKLFETVFKPFIAPCSINDIGSVFGLAPLVDKEILYDSDTDMDAIINKALEFYKKITGNDGMATINAKNIPQFQYNFEFFWFIIVLNQLKELPEGVDIKAFFERVLLVNFGKTIKNVDPTFKKRILLEKDQWFTKLVQKEYIAPFKYKNENVEDIWMRNALPHIHIIEEIFEFSPNYNDTIPNYVVYEIMRIQYQNEGKIMPNITKIRQKIAEKFRSLNIRSERDWDRRLKQNIYKYRNIKLRDNVAENIVRYHKIQTTNKMLLNLKDDGRTAEQKRKDDFYFPNK